MGRQYQQLRLAIITSLLSFSSACTVLELQQDGFASNAMYLLHALPIFLKQNGTFFIDSSAFPYTCNEEGGSFMDFFIPEQLVVPWCVSYYACLCCMTLPCIRALPSAYCQDVGANVCMRGCLPSWQLNAHHEMQ